MFQRCAEPFNGNLDKKRFLCECDGMQLLILLARTRNLLKRCNFSCNAIKLDKCRWNCCVYTEARENLPEKDLLGFFRDRVEFVCCQSIVPLSASYVNQFCARAIGLWHASNPCNWLMQTNKTNMGTVENVVAVVTQRASRNNVNSV